MLVRFAPPPVVPSPLGRLDGRWRLAGLLAAGLAVALVRSPLGAALALAAALILMIFARVPPRWAANRLGAVALLLGLFALPLPLLVAGDGLDLGPITLSTAGARFAAVIVGKGLAVAALAGVLLTSAPPEAHLKAAHALRVPGVLVTIVALTYRYLFLIADELARLRVAVRARGFRGRANWHSYRTVGHVTGSLLVRGHDRAERVAHAMRCRGFDGTFRALTDFHTRLRDVLFVLLVALGAAVTLWLDGFPSGG